MDHQPPGRPIIVCGATDEHNRDYLCILPPAHIEHTTSSAGVVWHKHVTVKGLSLEFATTPPGYQRPKLADLAGLFADAPITREGDSGLLPRWLQDATGWTAHRRGGLMPPPTCLLLDDAAAEVAAVDPGLARKFRAQAYHMREWGYRTHEYNRLVDVAARVLPRHPGVPR